jgi:mono/diheme cytochrome c family protein
MQTAPTSMLLLCALKAAPALTLAALVIGAPPAAGADAAAGEAGTFAAAVAPFFKDHCVDCHGPESRKGKFTLHEFGENVRAHRTGYAAVLERLLAGDMPPDSEPRPDATKSAAVAAWIRAGLAKPPDKSAPSVAALLKPSEGNRLPHALLFGAAAGETVPPPPRLWRLSPSGYMEGLVGSIRSRHKDLSQPFDLAPEPGLKDYAALYSVDVSTTEILLRNAERIVDGQTMHQIVDSPEGRRVEMSHDTTGDFKPLLNPDQPPTAEQLDKAILTQFRMALAREPSADEKSRLLALFEKGRKAGDHVSAAKSMLMASLLLPEAVYRFELGEGAQIRPGVRMLSPRELAFAISLTLCDRREGNLFSAAEKGGLNSRESVSAEVRRILDDSKIRKPRLLGFFREYFGYDRAPDIFKDRPTDVIHRPEVLVQDTDRLILSILDADRDVLKELLTTRKAFVNFTTKEDKKTRQQAPMPAQEAHPINDKGCKSPQAVYGFDSWPQNQPVDLPGERIGILMQPSWLVAWSGNFDNDPVRRGRWIRERLLGGTVPDLPIGVAAKVPDEPDHTLRHRLRVTRVAECWKCHQRMDDLGLAFESFDHYGKPRATEPVLDEQATAMFVDRKGKALGTVNRGEVLDCRGAISTSGDPSIDGAVGTPAELMRRLAGSDRVRQVFIRHVFRYYLGRNETPGDARTLQDADAAYLAAGGSFKALLVSLLTSESYLCRATAAPAPQSSASPQ